MNVLRLFAMLWLFYVTLRILRSFKDALGGPPRPGTGGAGSPFDAYGPFGRFGPFGPNGPFGPQSGRPGAPPPNPGGYAWQDPFAGGDPFAQQRAQQQQQQQQQRAPAQAPPKGPYEILGIRPGAPMPEVRRAYQDLVRQYHPDRTDGLGPELRALAEQRTKEITAAYNQIKRRG